MINEDSKHGNRRGGEFRTLALWSNIPQGHILETRRLRRIAPKPDGSSGPHRISPLCRERLSNTSSNRAVSGKSKPAHSTVHRKKKAQAEAWAVLKPRRIIAS